MRTDPRGSGRRCGHGLQKGVVWTNSGQQHRDPTPLRAPATHRLVPHRSLGQSFSRCLTDATPQRHSVSHNAAPTTPTIPPCHIHHTTCLRTRLRTHSVHIRVTPRSCLVHLTPTYSYMAANNKHKPNPTDHPNQRVGFRHHALLKECGPLDRSPSN